MLFPPPFISPRSEKDIHPPILGFLQFVSEGYPLIGYCMWSFLDVVSSHEGFNKRYGLVYVDRTNDNPKSCKRIKKQSFYWYKDVIKNNGIEKVGEK